MKTYIIIVIQQFFSGVETRLLADRQLNSHMSSISSCLLFQKVNVVKAPIHAFSGAFDQMGDQTTFLVEAVRHALEPGAYCSDAGRWALGKWARDRVDLDHCHVAFRVAAVGVRAVE